MNLPILSVSLQDNENDDKEKHDSKDGVEIKEQLKIKEEILCHLTASFPATKRETHIICIVTHKLK